MPIDDPDDEDWYDDDDEPVEDDSSACPECGKPIHAVTGKCPACGYWITDADRRAMWAEGSQPRWIKLTALITLAAFVLSLLALAVSGF